MAKFVATVLAGAFALILLSGCSAGTAPHADAGHMHEQTTFGGGGGGEGGGY